jgi:anti-sigma-K factor RskA
MNDAVHPMDDVAAYALGVLDDDELRALRLHLESCATCRAEVRAFEETAWAIAETQGRDAPLRLRAAIVERARHDGERRAPRGLAGFWRELLRPVPLAVPLALTVVLVVALVGYGSARRDADRYSAVVAGAVGAKVVPRAATGATAGVRGSLVIPANGSAPYLILDLPAPASGKTWEAWVIRGGTPVRAGVTDARGVTALTLTANVAGGDTIAVTQEPAGGVDAPTGAPVLAGTS